MLETAAQRPMGKSVRVADSLGHKQCGDFVITGPFWVWVECRLWGKCQLGVKGSCHRGQVPTPLSAEGDALHDRTGPEVTSCKGNDILTRWHICNYHSWLSLHIVWAPNHPAFSATQQVFLYGLVFINLQGCTVAPPAVNWLTCVTVPKAQLDKPNRPRLIQHLG